MVFSNMPLVADCRDQSIDSFMKHMSDNVYGALRHSYYPILLLYQKYNFEVNILFQVVPNWIADDFSEIEDDEANEIFNQVLNSYSDYLTDFFVQIYQNGEDYKLVITHTKKYSESMVNDFKDTYMTILSNIINTDMSLDLSSTLK